MEEKQKEEIEDEKYLKPW